VNAYFFVELARQSARLLGSREWAENDRTELLAVNARAESLAGSLDELRPLADPATLITMMTMIREGDRLAQRVQAVISSTRRTTI
jgi:hypothetical protein